MNKFICGLLAIVFALSSISTIFVIGYKYGAGKELKTQRDYIVQQCTDNKYVIIYNTLIMCPEIIVNKQKGKVML